MTHIHGPDITKLKIAVKSCIIVASKLHKIKMEATDIEIGRMANNYLWTLNWYINRMEVSCDSLDIDIFEKAIKGGERFALGIEEKERKVDGKYLEKLWQNQCHQC